MISISLAQMCFAYTQKHANQMKIGTFIYWHVLKYMFCFLTIIYAPVICYVMLLTDIIFHVHLENQSYLSSTFFYFCNTIARWHVNLMAADLIQPLLTIPLSHFSKKYNSSYYFCSVVKSLNFFICRLTYDFQFFLCMFKLILD